ncbi:uncharacterized protein CMU_010550 [Cryptosporidium muris RN66]|uniref:RNA ligase domain-containing protein n=1 Tax=Cryptosporidium muris (strain RN66) TaxID=441375 RepID=B6AIR6_CRYMR|nr:uncharacterized protein CMU_010550 [Cryptosporidium muris RN66]EEA08107.1 hypothetical protein, conserved [Cryptosporidium muris RN66]|eukprot:XP_002142456.1 hypothetical protein [Cryptosporidium muris RN66]
MSLATQIYNYIRQNNSFFHVVCRDVSIITFDALDEVWDIGIKGRRDEEDKILRTSSDLREIVRRGCSLGIKFHGSKEQKYWYECGDNVVVYLLRRGLPKFENLCLGKDFHLQSKSEEDLKDVEIILTEKIDGENSQISFFSLTNHWIIASKNVTILCSESNDINHSIYLENRYTAVKLIARAWFNLIDSLRPEYNIEHNMTNINRIRNILSGNTLLAELVGNIDRQHIVNYNTNSELKLYFFGMVPNNNNNICFNPEDLFVIFPQKLQENIVPFLEIVDSGSHSTIVRVKKRKERITGFKSVDELKKSLCNLQEKVLSFNDNCEGTVIYITRYNKEYSCQVLEGIDLELCQHNETLQIFKIKTLYYIYRRCLRESLRRIIRNEIISLCKYSREYNKINMEVQNNEWNQLYNFFLLRLPVLTSKFINTLLNIYRKILRCNCKVTHRIKQVLLFSETNIYNYILLFQTCIVRITSIVFIGYRYIDIDYLQLDMNLFNYFCTFIKSVEESVAQKLFPLRNLDPKLIPDKNSYAIEVYIPPFYIPWKYIRSKLAEMLLVSEETLVLSSQCYLTGTKLGIESQDRNISNNIIVNMHHLNKKSSKNPKVQILNIACLGDDYSNVNNLLNGNIQFLNRCFYKNLTILNHSETPSITQLLISKDLPFLQTANILSRYISEICKIIGSDRAVSKHIQINTLYANKINIPITSDIKTISSISELTNYMPWNCQTISDFLPPDYALNKRDFQLLIKLSFLASDRICSTAELYPIKNFNNGFIHCLSGYSTASNRLRSFQKLGHSENSHTIECTVILPCGLPGSGKTSLLTEFMKQISTSNNPIHMETLTVNAELLFSSIEDCIDDAIYSLAVLPRDNESLISVYSYFDLVLYVSSDGCTKGAFNGVKPFSKSESSSKYYSKVGNIAGKCCNLSTDIYGLNDGEFRKYSRKGKRMMHSIVHSILCKCLDIKFGKIEDIWCFKLSEMYSHDYKIKALIIIDANNIPDILKLQMIHYNNESYQNDILFRFIAMLTPYPDNIDNATKYLGCELNQTSLDSLNFINKDDESDFIECTAKSSKNEWPYIWSPEVVIQCIIRIANRQYHPTLMGLTQKNIDILLCFLNLYSKKVFVKDNTNLNTGNMFQLSKELFEVLNFDGYISIDTFSNGDSDMILKSNLTKKAICILRRIIPNIKLLRSNSELQLQFQDFLSIISKISSRISYFPSIKLKLEAFSNQLFKIVSMPKKVNTAKENYYTGTYSMNREISHIKSAKVFVLEEDFDYAAISLVDKSILNKIREIWVHFCQDFKLPIDMKQYELIRKHITTFFFKSNNLGNINGGNNKTSPELFSLSNSKLNHLAALISMSFFNEVYLFRCISLVYVPIWGLSFIVLESQQEFLSIPNDSNNLNSESRYLMEVKIPTNIFIRKYLPFRMYGVPHITLISTKVKPVTSNYVIQILKRDLPHLVSKSEGDCILNSSFIKINDELVEIHSKHLWKENIEIKGALRPF